MTTATRPESGIVIPGSEIIIPESDHRPRGAYRVADLFCGAGGSSTGARKAIEKIGGRMELVAVNHWPVAVETHQRNHPEARHYVTDLETADPEVIVPEGWLDLLMASPECRFYSRARGGRPILDQNRYNPWIVQRWLTSLDVRCLIVENVPEFVEWGRLDPGGRPDKKHKGEHFQAWFLTFQALGYQAEWRMLNAADYGDPTTRTRFFLMARKDGPVMWPEPSHAKGDTGMFPGRLAWRGAREVIDWSNPGRSLLDDPKYLKKPLSEKTRRRIARGLERFGGPLAPLYIQLLDLPTDDPASPPGTLEGMEHPFILNRNGENGGDRAHSVDTPVPTATGRGAGYLVEPETRPFHGSDRQHTVPRGIDQPIYTVTTLTGGGSYLVQPVAEPFVGANRNNNVPKGIDQPVPTATSAHGGGSFLVEPCVQAFMLGQQSGGAPRSTDDPTPTVAGAGAVSLVQPLVIEYYGQSYARDIDAPLSAVTSMNKHGLAKPILVEYYGQSGGADVDEPLPTVTTKARHGLANPTLVEVNHGGPADDRRTRSVDEPLGTLTSKRGIGLAQPVLVQTSQTGGNGSYVRPTEDPLPTLTTKADMCLATPSVDPFIVPNFGERKGQEPRVHDLDEPVPAVTSRGAGSLVRPRMAPEMLDQDFLRLLEEGGIDPRRVVLVNGQPFLLDIRFRMLQNAELARAMGFSDEEQQYEFVGNTGQVTKQIGNAVAVGLAAALVGAAIGPMAGNDGTEDEG